MRCTIYHLPSTIFNENGSLIPNPESLIPNPESRIPDPESRIPNPESPIPNPQLHCKPGEEGNFKTEIQNLRSFLRFISKSSIFELTSKALNYVRFSASPLPYSIFPSGRRIQDRIDDGQGGSRWTEGRGTHGSREYVRGVQICCGSRKARHQTHGGLRILSG